MTREETLALYAQGKAAWNAWAEARLAEKAAMEATGTWAAERDWMGNLEAKNDATRAWMAAARADFCLHVFVEAVDFSGFLFPGVADLSGAKFEKGTEFAAATFSGLARFVKATFSGDAGFEGATFSGNAWFSGATFSGDARFKKATFSADSGFSEAIFAGDAGFREATFSGRAGFENATFSGDAWFSEATFTGTAGFSWAKFSGNAGFSEATLSGGAGFSWAKFSRGAEFDKAMFSGDAWFSEATFSGTARFDKATFSGDAWFGAAKFSRGAEFDKAMLSGDAVFENATFSGNAGFAQSRFNGYTAFDQARFESDARFTAMQGESFFSLRGVTFAEVPDFEQAHFAEAPRLDVSHFLRARDIRWRFWERKNLQVKANSASEAAADATARWRALKRLANQGHDHEREQLFFAHEMQSLRGSTDWAWPRPLNVLRREKTVPVAMETAAAKKTDAAPPAPPAEPAKPKPQPTERRIVWLWQAGETAERVPLWRNGTRYWFGWFYELFSDFGRSILRPLVWLVVLTGLFTWLYLGAHLDAARMARPKSAATMPTSAALWLAQSGLSAAHGAAAAVLPARALPAAPPPPPVLTCIAGPEDPLIAAFMHSMGRTLFGGLTAGEKQAQTYACLFGVNPEASKAQPPQLPNQFTTVIPYWVVLLGLFQTVISGVLIFLLLLAVRNQFRIR